MPVDGFGRRVDYLRLSVTDRCNLRCAYCLPVVHEQFRPSEEILSDDEVVGLVSRFAEVGFKNIRITGGEPLVRPGLPRLIGRIASIPGITDISMSTNGLLLGKQAAALAASGLRRVNISLDSLDASRFKGITRFGNISDVLEGIEAAFAAGLGPVKINCVAARGVNEDEIGAFSDMTLSRPLHVRFIELMPMGPTSFFSSDRHLPLAEMMARAGTLEKVGEGEAPRGYGPARYYRKPGGLGTVGFISALSCGFCESCNRVRLSATGTLVPCLDGEEGTDLRGPLRAGESAEALRLIIRDTVYRKPERHSMVERAAEKVEGTRTMCSIGG